MPQENALVGIIMGSDSDWPQMKAAAEACAELGVPWEARVMSAHRTPEEVADYAKSAAGRGLRVIIAGAGGAAHLAGVVASFTTLPVVAVPIETKLAGGLDSLLAMVQMPPGVPVAVWGWGLVRTPASWRRRSSRQATPLAPSDGPFQGKPSRAVPRQERQTPSPAVVFWNP